MMASSSARALALLLACIRLLAAVLALLLLVFAIRGAPLSVDRLASVPRSVGAVITTSVDSTVDSSPRDARPVGRARLRRQFQGLFAHHATLVVRFMRSTVAEDPGFVDAANAVLVRNTDDLRAALAQIIDADDAATFAQGWQSQTQALFGYAAAVRDDDAAARQEARSELASHVDEQAALLTEATDGRVDDDMVAASLRMQVDLLLYQIDAYARADYDQAYELQHEAYTHMYPFAAGLAAAATGRRQDAVQPRPVEELTAQMSSLLGMHVELSVDALRAAVAGSDEFTAASAALDGNSRALSATLDGLLKTRPSRRLDALWAEQTDLLMRYAVAVAEDESSSRRLVRQRLRTVSARFERILRAVTDDDAVAAAAADALSSQQTLLLDQVVAHARGDYATAHDIAYSAHHRVDDLAHALASALVAGLPRGGAQTGGGGTAGL